MSIRSYCARLEDTLFSRRDATIEKKQLIIADTDAVFVAHVRFHNGSMLVINEEIEVDSKRRIRRLGYVFHYQQVDGKLIFRYDNSPHYPHLATFPAHKHVGELVIAAEPPDLADVLYEINEILYPGTNK